MGEGPSCFNFHFYEVRFLGIQSCKSILLPFVGYLGNCTASKIRPSAEPSSSRGNARRGYSVRGHCRNAQWD